MILIYNLYWLLETQLFAMKSDHTEAKIVHYWIFYVHSKVILAQNSLILFTLY